MPITLELRHRLLYMRASLERNSGQSKFHCIHTGPSCNSRIRNQEGKTSWPQIWESSRKQRIYYLAHNLKKRCKKRDFTGIHDRFLAEIMFSANGCSNTIEMKMFVVNGTILQMKITPIESQNQNTYTTSKSGGSPSRSRETLQNQEENVLTSTKRCLH